MNKTKIEWTDYDKGWLSALIDGEGSISLLKEIRPKYRAGLTYKPRINISNKNRALLEKAKEIIGHGAILGPNGKGVYNFDVSANGCREILRRIKLIAKWQQQILLLDALNILNRRCGRSKPPRTDEEISRLDKIAKTMRRLNKDE